MKPSEYKQMMEYLTRPKQKPREFEIFLNPKISKNNQIKTLEIQVNHSVQIH